ncbi:RNA polymerase, sigma-24 subunit, ECF subfamily [Pseudopedobacter saltans DSM 12145]|uniref:RNA polymerase, sigma-24 subunit, ECF subfamily n=1 Tax=Pseudopedobacter saltans (strain ATCC 51119 / DSM 12145 / JCM 21818 / CCUG 39354 / LMG 10337 / NBRC 100064 / NCIMB 13643) TaxID=762903 RepID=F0S5Y8_PSESL|nr:RNA polymerase sigma-70 factor [Pseudopedobacter saltans]ADY52091.1 RNA polymerase, sigma-24 subunit, ECF subfamily [Pseudopedobacter saltans DSM 12145]
MKNLKLYTDAELFDLVKNGHSFAFSEIYNRYWEILFRHAYRLLKDKDLAKDIVQEVFVSLWDKIGELDLQFSINAYLYKSVRNKVLNLIEKDKVKNNYLESLAAFINSSEAITDYRLRERLLKEKIEKEIADLPPKMRQIFEMSRKQNLSHRQIAKELNLSDKTVKKQMSNAIKILRLKLGGFIVLSILLKLISI